VAFGRPLCFRWQPIPLLLEIIRLHR